MSEELRNAVEMGQYDLTDYEELDLQTELEMTYIDYISAADYD